MVSTLTTKEKKAVHDLVRIAGSELQFERALLTLEKRLGSTPTGDQLLNYLLRQKIAEKTQKLQRMRAGE
jgi:hypothetical protein